jgi:prepilin-type processing-associated H-X9-DG protein
MNSWLRTKLNTDPNAGWSIEFGEYLAQRQKHSEILIPVPSSVLVFVDEHDQSIYDGAFHVTQANRSDALTKDGSVEQNSPDVWLKLPADRHNQGANLSFADGHVQSQHWKAPKKFRGYNSSAAPGADLQDLRYMQSVIPRLR